MVHFSFSGEKMLLAGERALFWPRMEALLVADLHLEKASFFARHGQMLPPYDSRDTLTRLANAIRRTGARRVFALGDNFHDGHAHDRLDPHTRGMLDALTRAVDWTWIIGNHDGAAHEGVEAGGNAIEEVRLGNLVLRHRVCSGEDSSEISGHFHPKFTLQTRGRRIARPCAVLAERGSGPARLILPAFGTLTGGMPAQDPAIVAAMQPADRIDALVPLADRLAQFPLWRAAA